MEITTIKRIFHFLEKNENIKIPFLWKLKNNEPLTKEDLVINGDLSLKFKNIKLLPFGLEVRGDLNLVHTKIISLPKELKVGGSLNLIFCTNIKSLPKGLQIGGDLYLWNTKLAKLSDEALLKMIEPNGFIKGSIIK